MPTKKKKNLRNSLNLKSLKERRNARIGKGASDVSKDNKQTQLPGQIALEEVLDERASLGQIWQDTAKLFGQLRKRYERIDKRLTDMPLEIWSSAEGQRLQRLADNLFTAALQLEDAMEVISRAQRI